MANRHRAEERRIDGPGEGRHMFLPPMCPIGAAFMAAVFRSIGYRAEVLEENDQTLAVGYKYTAGGECVPCPCTVGALVHAMQERELDPEQVIFFMPTACGPCRFGQYAKLDEIIFRNQGWDGIRIMSPSAENAYAGIDNAARKRLFHAIIVSDVVRKLGMRVRPYEQEPGRTDAVIEEGIRNIVKAFETPDHTAPAALEKLVEEVRRIPVRAETRPLVGIVGEIYVRSDPFINMQLYRRIEELGGEAWLAPIGEWILYTNECTRRVAKEEGKGWVPRLKGWIEGHWFHHVEQKYYAIADPVLHDRHEPPLVDVMEEGEKHLPWHFEGEALLTLGRAELFVKRDGASAVVNASPAFCMPGTVTTSIFPKMEKELGVPILCNFYDGSGDPNQGLVPMMHYLVEATRQKAAPA